MIKALDDLIAFNSEFLLDMLSDSYQFRRDKAQRLVDSIETEIQ